MADKIYVDDWGTEIIVDAGGDITGATTSNLLITNPDGTTDTWVGTVYTHPDDGLTNYIRYVSVVDDFDQVGIYSIIADFVTPSWTGSGNPITFTVFALNDFITISDMHLNQIKSAIAFPSVDNVILTDDEIKDFCIRPALRDYFTKFPKKAVLTGSLTTSGEVEIAFPDDLTFGVVDARITDKLSNDSANTGNFWELASFNKYGLSARKRTYGIEGYNPNFLRQQKITEMQAERSVRDNVEAIRIKVDTDNSVVSFFTNQTCKYFIEWAKWSRNFDDVKFQRINDVIKLCQANVKEQLADTVGLVTNASLDITINADELRSQASELRDPIIEKWAEFPDMTLINI